eukprot:IDg23501t1
MLEIVEVNLSACKARPCSFNGACIDIKEIRTAIGKPKFGKHREASTRKAQIRVLYADNNYMNANVDVSSIDVPLHNGLESLDKYKLYVDSVDNLLVCKDFA